MKYCVNCIHFSPKEGDDTHAYAKCSRTQQISPVTGQPRIHSAMTFAEVARMASQPCGPDALLFEENTNV